MDKICVLIRVYNRTEDLQYCVDIIRKTWKKNSYYILVVANGKADGFIIPDKTITKIDKLIEIEKNIGHFSGNSQLLLAGLPFIPFNCTYTLILEADTWVYGDELICRYIKKLNIENAVWASAQFFRYVENLATDFAIINTKFLNHCNEVFVFTGTPEYFVANYLREHGYKYLYINENMPINLPRYIKGYPFAPNGRFFAFEKSKMVTHHIEVLKKGMAQKKYDFNMVSGTDFFELKNARYYSINLIGLIIAKALSKLLPYKGWFFKLKKSEV